ncbi:MAG TPA: amidophosphoribosyltransferase [Candidatus Faecousia excrementigallinarum]|uniref:Amidophosphoribosyltransferase n=1 Tax=Candidatus Faecousia excrementigallinarum TaxID=2840806 RepID=A0A9D1CLM0_9FIRM|nr:amidophosphoribosyltransferase [Candidatus Faecousia excrementigallinarum]
MGGFFGAVARRDVVLDVFFGVDYHSHLGNRRAGMVVYDGNSGYQRQIHSIENTPFRTKFEVDLHKFSGHSGIGCISDTDPQPLLVRSHLGLFAISTVGIINNADALVEKYFSDHGHQFMAMSSGAVNATELTAALINEKETLIDGIHHAQQVIDGSVTILILQENRIIAARDRLGRLPVLVGKGEDGCCVSFESFAYSKLGYADHYELGPGEIVSVTADGVEQLSPPGKDMKICAFLWTYYGYPNSNYEGRNVEVMRYRNGEIMAQKEMARGTLPDVDYVAGVPDSGLPHAIGYANFCHKPFARPFVKYTPTWPRSFTPANQAVRNQVAKMKQIPVPELIEGKKLLFVDDSIVRGTQLRETVDFLYESGAKEVHMRSACPPVLFNCKYLNFSRSNSVMELIARKTMYELEGEEADKHIDEYVESTTERGQCLAKAICKKLGFDSLGYQSLDGLLESIGIDKEKICTYCWNGKE